MSDIERAQATVASTDGTRIAYEQSGDGLPIVLVASALADRSDTRKLAALLAPSHTVINYDRRGRGASGDAAPYAVEREIEDIEALIDAVGGSASLFGSSSGAVLALDAANQMPGKVRRLALYEPPFITDDSRPPLGDEFSVEVAALLAADRRSEAVKLFMKAIGVPGIGVAIMRLLPGWSAMCTMAHTLPYDLAILRGTQAGTPLPADRWSHVTAPTLVLTGEKSEAHFHAGARSLTQLLQVGAHRVLKGQHHGSVAMGSRTIANALVEFLAADGAHAGTTRPHAREAHHRLG
jgi:pimeloyl-ACP methyl ester carboxylesterase